MLIRACIITITGIYFLTPALYAETYREFKLQPRQQSLRNVDRPQLRLNELSKDLNLTTEQAAKVKAILIGSQEEASQIIKEAKDSVKNVHVKANDEISLLLNDAQKAQFKKIRKKHETAFRVQE